MMSIDLSKLTPASWETWHANGSPLSEHRTVGTPAHDVAHDVDPADAEFIALARNAFDVMMRRGWWPILLEGEWFVANASVRCKAKEFGAFCIWQGDQHWQDPITAIVEADRWFKENVEHGG